MVQRTRNWRRMMTKRRLKSRRAVSRFENDDLTLHDNTLSYSDQRRSTVDTGEDQDLGETQRDT